METLIEGYVIMIAVTRFMLLMQCQYWTLLNLGWVFDCMFLDVCVCVCVCVSMCGVCVIS